MHQCRQATALFVKDWSTVNPRISTDGKKLNFFTKKTFALGDGGKNYPHSQSFARCPAPNETVEEKEKNVLQKEHRRELVSNPLKSS